MCVCVFLSNGDFIFVLGFCFVLKESQISDLMDNSGDSSKQLTLLNDELVEKDRFVLH